MSDHELRHPEFIGGCEPCEARAARISADRWHEAAEQAERDRAIALASAAALVGAALEALRELADLMDAVRTDDYSPDSFTTQPARAALAALDGGGDVREWASALWGAGWKACEYGQPDDALDVDAALASPPALLGAEAALAGLVRNVVEACATKVQAVADEHRAEQAEFGLSVCGSGKEHCEDFGCYSFVETAAEVRALDPADLVRRWREGGR